MTGWSVVSLIMSNPAPSWAQKLLRRARALVWRNLIRSTYSAWPCAGHINGTRIREEVMKKDLARSR